MIHVVSGAEFTCSGFDVNSVFTAVTSPDIGVNSSETALTDSIVPNTSPFATVRPTSGSSTYTTSPS